MASPYQIAASMAGTREGQTALTDYLRTGGVNIDPTTRAWCADFVNATLAKSGAKGTDSSLARSFMNWGQSVSQPQQGDIAVFSRGDPNGSLGHVGFFDKINPDGSIRVLGGNQSNSVSYGNYPASRLLGYRRAADGQSASGLPGKIGGDSMVARNMDPQIAAATNTPAPGANPQLPQVASATPTARPPNGLFEILKGGADKVAANPLLSALMQPQQAPEPMQLQPMPQNQSQAPSLTDYLKSFMQSRMV